MEILLLGLVWGLGSGVKTNLDCFVLILDSLFILFQSLIDKIGMAKEKEKSIFLLLVKVFSSSPERE